MDEEKTYACRLNVLEKEYLEKYFNSSFSDYVHNSFKRDIIMTKNNKKKNMFQKFGSNFIMLGIGAMFIFFMFTQNNLMGVILTFLLGAFFIVSGLANIFFEIKGMIKK